ncbi:MAG: hypothetical protein KOO62_13015 [candidate division Zixibacteria bacterium]|nr:hypothetical protein [candidate division Zixibacteria bacterium]
MCQSVDKTQPVCKEFCDQADEFQAWVTDRIADLDALIADHEFIGDPKNKLLITVDFFDIFEVAFPQANPIKRYGYETVTGPIKDEILRELAGRVSLLFGLPEDSVYYPLWIPSPYVSEFYKCLWHPEIGASDQKRLSRELRNLESKAQEKYKKSLAELLGDLKQGAPDSRLLEFIIELCPELFSILCGSFERGIELTKRLFEDNRVTLDIRDWGLPDSIRDTISQDGKITGLGEADLGRWIKRLKEECKRQGLTYRISWQRDIEAVAMTDYLNKVLAKYDYRVVFVSSAHMVNRVLRANPEWTRWHDSDGKPIPHTTFFRGLDVFRFYDRFSRGQRNNVNPKSVIDQARSDRKLLREVVEPQNAVAIQQFISDRKDRREECAKNPLEVSKYCEGSLNVTPEICQLVQNVNTIRKKLFDVHLMYSSHLFVRYFERGNLELPPNGQHPSDDFDRAVALLQDLQNVSESHDSDITAHVLKLKTLMSAEFRLWVAMSRLKSVGPTSDEIRMLFVHFTMFPYRVRFENEGLLEEVKQLRSLHYYPKQSPTDEELNDFYEILERIAAGSMAASDPAKSYWGQKLELTSLDKDSLERHLAVMVLLLSLGSFQGAYRSAEQLAEMDSVHHFRGEFRIVAAQARLREYTENKAKFDTPAEKIEAIGRIIGICQKLNSGEETVDYRAHYLAAYAAGQLARANSKFRQMALDFCKKARDEVEKEPLEADWTDPGRSGGLIHLKATIWTSLAYYRAIEALERENTQLVLDAIRIHEEIVPGFMKEDRFTAICMHNKAFTYYVLAVLSDEPVARQNAAAEARRCYNIALGRRLDPEVVERVLKRQISRLQSTMDSSDSKDDRSPWSLVDAYKQSKQKFKDVLALIKTMLPSSNKEGKQILRSIEKKFGGESRLDRDVRLLDELMREESA